MVRFGIIGAGRIGYVHARSISQHEEAELVSITDPVEANAQRVVKEFGGKIVADADQIFADPEIDAVVVCSPTPLHIEHIIKGTKAGKAVMCEKPVAMETAAVEELYRQLEGENVRVMMGFNRRFDPNFAEAHELLEKGEIGELQQVTIISRDPAAPPAEYIKVSGGIFKDMTIHDFDMARFFLGDITEVSAVGQNMDPEIAKLGDFDGCVITLKSAAGKVATIVNSRTCATGYDQRLEAFGSKGSVFVENVRPTTVRLSQEHFSASQGPYLDFFLERYQAAYSQELSDFIAAFQGKRDFSPSVYDGVKALQIAEAAEKSAKSGETVKL